MSTPDTRRPGGVTFIIVLIWLSAIVNAALGVWLVLAQRARSSSP